MANFDHPDCHRVGHIDIYAAEHGDEALRAALLAQRLSSSHATLALRPTEDGGDHVPPAGGAAGLPKDGDIYLQQRDVTLATFRAPGDECQLMPHHPTRYHAGLVAVKSFALGDVNEYLGVFAAHKERAPLPFEGTPAYASYCAEYEVRSIDCLSFLYCSDPGPRRRPTIYCAPWAASAAPTPPTPSPAACPTPWPLEAPARRCARRARTASAAAPRSSGKRYVLIFKVC